ncbi:lysoplasmalogenase family protein [Lacinutrix gracilariae]|uniref:Lysoplasmalogenase family protein n=1 Tax=Lacinutrix gracilariae TaxID=1747198 RepID=A0ABW5JYX3_9FLAO
MFIFKDKFYFSIFFFSILIIDVFFKVIIDLIPLRVVTKSLVVGSLLVYFCMHIKNRTAKDSIFMIMALSFFILGDLLFIFKDFIVFFLLGILSFTIGKLFYVFRFSNQNDFKLVHLFPVLAFCFIYMFLILSVIYDNLKEFFIPVLAYLFIALIVLLFAYLRKSEVDKKSFFIVGIGILFSVIADSIAVLARFYNNDIFYSAITVMLFYGTSQYLIVMGILDEKVIKQNSVLYNDNLL